jgi:hypothetical protein
LDFQNLQVLRSFDTIRYLPIFEVIIKEFNDKYKSILKKNKRKIAEWTDQAIKKLHHLSDDELINYFPNTTKKERKLFRTNYAQNKSNHKTTKNEKGWGKNMK